MYFLHNGFPKLARVAMAVGAAGFLLTVSCVLPDLAVAQNQCPTASQVEGAWEPKIRDGDEVCIGSILRAKKGASVTLEFKEKKTKVRKTCVVESGCRIPVLDSGGSAAEQGIVNRVLAAFGRNRLSLENGAIMAVSRGLEPELQDCVVSLNGAQVELGPAFKELKPGKYWVRLEPLPKAGHSLGPIEVQWTGVSANVSGTGLNTGLHELTLVEKTGEPAGSESWILVAPAETAKKESTSFQDAVRLSQKWTEESDPVAIRIVLRAYLESLGDGNPLVETP